MKFDENGGLTEFEKMIILGLPIFCIAYPKTMAGKSWQSNLSVLIFDFIVDFLIVANIITDGGSLVLFIVEILMAIFLAYRVGIKFTSNNFNEVVSRSMRWRNSNVSMLDKKMKYTFDRFVTMLTILNAIIICDAVISNHVS